MIAFTDSYAAHLGLRFGDDGVRLMIRPDLINHGGMLLGAVVFSLVDYAMTAELLKVRTPDERIATTHIALSFVASASEGEVRCTATLDRRGGRTAFLSARVGHEDGRLLATAIGTFAISW